MANPGSLPRNPPERRLPTEPGARPQSPLRELFAPLEQLLTCGGDARLDIDPATGRNGYGCSPIPTPGIPSFSSSTATTISSRGYEAAERARNALMASAMLHGLIDCFDARAEAMRDELKALLGLDRSGAEIVFAASGTDAQLVALALSRALLGDDVVSLIAAADQTGTGTVHTARGQHFGARSANGVTISRGDDVAGLGPVRSVALNLRDPDGRIRSPSAIDADALELVESAVAQGARVMLETMDCSKLGHHAPSDRCAAEIAARWPGRVQIVVDACQARLSRRRIAHYLDRGCIVLLTGSKYFAGPAFSGAVLVPPVLVRAIGALKQLAPGLAAYAGRSDWPQRWRALRAQFPAQPNFGAWLRWEAALEEMRAYYAVPESFRRDAVRRLGEDFAHIITASPPLTLLPPQSHPENGDEFALPTIFGFTLTRGGRTLSLAACRALYRAFADADPSGAHAPCLIGQPVGWGGRNDDAAAAMRLCISARHVIDAAQSSLAPDGLAGIRDAAAAAIDTLESLLRQHDAHDNASKECHAH
jgi:hypothetical protein